MQCQLYCRRFCGGCSATSEKHKNSVGQGVTAHSTFMYMCHCRRRIQVTLRPYISSHEQLYMHLMVPDLLVMLLLD